MEILRTKLGERVHGLGRGAPAPLRVDDANVDPRGSTIPGTDDVDESMLVVPMRPRGHLVGVITLSKLGLRQFDEEDMRLLHDPRGPGRDRVRGRLARRGDPAARGRAAPAPGHEQRALAVARPGRRRGPHGGAPRPGRRAPNWPRSAPGTGPTTALRTLGCYPPAAPDAATTSTRSQGYPVTRASSRNGAIADRRRGAPTRTRPR